MWTSSTGEDTEGQHLTAGLREEHYSLLLSVYASFALRNPIRRRTIGANPSSASVSRLVRYALPCRPYAFRRRVNHASPMMPGPSSTSDPGSGVGDTL